MGERRSHWPLGTSGDERRVLAAVLEYQRETIVMKTEGLDDEAARRPGVPSGTSPAGVVKHLAHVERWWFHAVFAGRDVEFPWSENDRDADWRVEAGESLADLVAAYRAAWEESNRVAAAASSLDAVSFHEEHRVSLRWIYLHMIEETARHAGHVDILREQLDGSTGT
jgi:uncharacterized damage-inducible protein DinB